MNTKLSMSLINYLTICLNSICFFLSIVYILLPTYSILWDVFGIILLITIFEDLLLVYLNSIKIDKRKKFGKRLNLLGYLYLVFIILAMICLILGNLITSISGSNNSVYNLGAYAIIYPFFFGIFTFGILLGLLNIKYLKNKTLWKFKKKNREYELVKDISNTTILKKLFIIFSYIIFILGIILAIITLIGSFEIITTVLAIFSSQFGVFLSILFFANTILLLKLKGINWNTKKFHKKTTIGIVVSLSLLIPLILTNFTINYAENNFSEVLGDNWRDKIPEEVSQYFLKNPFTIPEYFLGIPPKDCTIEKDTLFYSGDGISLYFDAYMPLNNGENLPGMNSTLIRIHGGGWTFGDKGIANMLQMNKYFAAQGYVVFDIQYGLHDGGLFNIKLSSDNYKTGDFTIDDMINHIGIFTKYLTAHADKYGANLESVFISGGSSGGHLTCASALAIKSGKYPDIFSQKLKIKGFIPFYPANGQMDFFGIDGREEFKHPELLIDGNSPPCLIFQGTHDILNYFNIADNFRNTYITEGNEKCTILWMPLGGHVCDLYFSGYYNQIFLYYMERFLYLYH